MIKYLRIISLSSVFAVILFLSFAHPQKTSIEFDHLTLPDGITNFTAYVILRDRQGYMWFASDDGVYRYDGYNYKLFKNHPADSTSLAGSLVNIIFEDRQGDLWFGTLKGLSRLDRQSETFSHYKPEPGNPTSLLGEQVYDIFEDASGRLWVATWGGLNLLNRQKATFKRFLQITDSTDGLPDFRVMNICQDTWGVFWIATLNGLCAMQVDEKGNPQFTNFYNIPGDKNSLYGNSVYWAHQDRSGSMWVGTHAGLSRINRPLPNATGDKLSGVTFTRILPSEADAEEIIYRFAEDNEGNLWFSSWGKGLIRFNPEREQIDRYQHDPYDAQSPSGNAIVHLHVDPDSVGGALWVGTFNNVDMFFPNKRKFKHYQHDPNNSRSISNNHILAVLEDSFGDLWIGTEDGLNRSERGKNGFLRYFSDSEDPNSLLSNSIISLYEDRKNEVWIGTYSGLQRFDRAADRFVQDNNLIRIENRELRVNAYCEDAEGIFWLGTRHGLIRYDRRRQSVTKYDQDANNRHALPNSDVQALLIDSRGTFWVGTTGGLALFDKLSEKFYHFSVMPDSTHGLSSQLIRVIHEDSQGKIWVATDGGLNKLLSNPSTDPAKWQFEHFTEANGLPSNHISGILEDNAGNLWLSSSRGLTRLNPQVSESSFFTAVSKQKIKNYDVSDGLQSNDFTSTGYFKTRQGELLFGGINGLNTFFPDSIKYNSYVPPIVVTDFRIFDEPANRGQNINDIKSIKLNYRENFFSFEFSALDYTQPEKNRYAYMMEGLDETWIQSGRRRYANYTNLDPGSYVFRVKGSNNDGVWNHDGAAIRIAILPPFWQTWWFRTVVLGLFGLMLLWIHRYRVARLAEIQQVRTRIAEDLHDEISSSLASVRLYSEVVQQQLPDARKESAELLNRIRILCGEVSDGIRQIIWSVDPRHDQLPEMLSYLEREARQLFSAANIPLNWQGPKKSASVALQPEQRRTIYLIMKEAMINILRHSESSLVDFKCSREGNRLSFILADNGCGFHTTDEMQGNGLANMHKRAASIDARLAIESQPGKGTRVQLIIKIA